MYKSRTLTLLKNCQGPKNEGGHFSASNSKFYNIVHTELIILTKIKNMMYSDFSLNVIEVNNIKYVENNTIYESKQKVFSWLHNEFNGHINIVNTRNNIQDKSKLIFNDYFKIFHTNNVINHNTHYGSIIFVFILN